MFLCSSSYLVKCFEMKYWVLCLPLHCSKLVKWGKTLRSHYFFRSAYLLYYYDIYLKVQQELPHLPQSEINKKISESWRLLSVAERSYYLEKAKLEKEGLDPVSNFFPNLFLLWFNGKGLREINPCSPVFFSWEYFELNWVIFLSFVWYCLP